MSTWQWPSISEESPSTKRKCMAPHEYQLLSHIPFISYNSSRGWNVSPNCFFSRYEESLGDFQHAFKDLRGNQLIDYKALGLRHKLYACEVSVSNAHQVATAELTHFNMSQVNLLPIQPKHNHPPLEWPIQPFALIYIQNKLFLLSCREEF